MGIGGGENERGTPRGYTKNRSLRDVLTSAMGGAPPRRPYGQIGPCINETTTM